jgi:hypothetical protein
MKIVEKKQMSERSNVIVFSRQSGYDLSQEQLLEERLLARQAREMVQQWKEKRAAIQATIDAGGKIEPGPLRVELRTHSRPRGRSERKTTSLHISV